jgi:uncharacterized lipoprotein YajG
MITRLPFFFLLATICVGCVSAQKSTVEVPFVQATERGGELDLVMANIKVANFKDNTSPAVMVRFIEEQKTMAPDGDISKEVTNAVKQALIDRGFSLQASAPLTIEGEVSTWGGEVSGGFQKTIRCNAHILVSVIDSDGNDIYNGSYRGQSEYSSPVILEKNIKETLATAMSGAVGEMVGDRGLLNVASRARSSF